MFRNTRGNFEDNCKQNPKKLETKSKNKKFNGLFESGIFIFTSAGFTSSSSK